MIRLRNPKIRNLLETMPIKCRVENRPALTRACTAGERYFYKAVTTAAFTFMRGKVAYVEASDWTRAKRAMKRQLTGERGIHGKACDIFQTFTRTARGWKRMARRLRATDDDFIVDIYAQPTRPAGQPETGGLDQVELIDTIKCSNVMLVPPTATDRDVHGLVERLVATPMIRTTHEELVRHVQRTQGMELQRSVRDRTATAHLAWLIARALNIPAMDRQVLSPTQHVPEAIIAPTVLKARAPEATLAPTLERAFFKIVPAYSLEKLRRGDVQYVRMDEWNSGTVKFVQAYSRLSEDARAARGLPPGTMDAANEGSLQRDRVLLVPPKTDTLRLRRIIARVEASDPLFIIYQRMLATMDAEIGKGWSRTTKMIKAEEMLQMRLLRRAVNKHHALACPGDHSNAP